VTQDKKNKLKPMSPRVILLLKDLVLKVNYNNQNCIERLDTFFCSVSLLKKTLEATEHIKIYQNQPPRMILVKNREYYLIF